MIVLIECTWHSKLMVGAYVPIVKVVMPEVIIPTVVFWRKNVQYLDSKYSIPTKLPKLLLGLGLIMNL